MRAMILAAGRGERMRPLTDAVPKPLLKVADKPLIVYHIEALKRAGIDELVVNLGHFGNQIRDYLGKGLALGVTIEYSDEGDEILETAGGIINALPLLGDAPFVVTNADTFTDYDYTCLNRDIEHDAHLVLVDNPPHHPDGDFTLNNGMVVNKGQAMLTYSGIAVFKPAFFSTCQPGRYPLAPMLRLAAEQDHVSGEHYHGQWYDIGTPERLEALNKYTS